VFFLRRFVAVVLSMLGCCGSGRWESQQRHRCAGSRPGLQSRGGGRCDQQRARRDSSAPARCHRPCPPQPCQLEAACADPGVPGSGGGILGTGARCRHHLQHPRVWLVSLICLSRERGGFPVLSKGAGPCQLHLPQPCPHLPPCISVLGVPLPPCAVTAAWVCFKALPCLKTPFSSCFIGGLVSKHALSPSIYSSAWAIQQQENFLLRLCWILRVERVLEIRCQAQNTAWNKD